MRRPVTFISGVAQDTTNTKIGVPLALPADANLKFLIFDHTTRAKLYESAPKAFAKSGENAGEWSNPAEHVSLFHSDPISFTLQAGKQYHIGIVSDGMPFYAYRTDNTSSPYTQNGLTTISRNGYVVGYDNPELPTGEGFWDMGLVLYGADDTSAVPEPGAAVLFLPALAAVAVIRLRKR